MNQPPPSPTYVEIFRDDFNTFDTSKWTFEDPSFDNGNGEKQRYDSNHASVANGILTITAERVGSTTSWMSSKIFTRNKFSFKYGRIDARVRIPTDGAGPFPAVWAMPNPPEAYGAWPNSGELDLVEFSSVWTIPAGPQTFSGLHTANNNEGNAVGIKFPHDITQWAVYSLIWEPTYVSFLFNGNEVTRYTKPQNADFRSWPFDQNFYLIINLAMDPWWAPQSPLSLTQATFEVDYITVSQKV